MGVIDMNLSTLVKRIRKEGYSIKPPQDFFEGGIRVILTERDAAIGAVIVSTHQEDDGPSWIHASISFKERIPSYTDLIMIKEGVFGDDREAYQIFPKSSRHINIHPHALHLWGRVDGKRVLPDFDRFGTI